MKGFLLCLCALAVLFAPSRASDTESARQLRISRVLFPQTRSWQSVDSLPSPEPKALTRDRWKLRSVYLKSGQGGLMEDPDCSFILRALWEHIDEPLFRLADFDGDGFEDIAYSGNAQCREGHVTVIWFGAARRIVREDVTIISVRLLTAEMEGARRLSGISVGCCDDPVDGYILRDLNEQTAGVQARVHKAMHLPEGMELADEVFSARDSLVLRLAPGTGQKYKPGARDSLTGALLTDVVARYGPGVKGSIVAHFKDARGKRWHLVVIDAGNRSWGTEVPGGVNVGWIPVE